MSNGAVPGGSGTGGSNGSGQAPPTYTPPTEPGQAPPTYTPPTEPGQAPPTYTPPTEPGQAQPTYTPPTPTEIQQINNEIQTTKDLIITRIGEITRPTANIRPAAVASEIVKAILNANNNINKITNSAASAATTDINALRKDTLLQLNDVLKGYNLESNPVTISESAISQIQNIVTNIGNIREAGTTGISALANTALNEAKKAGNEKVIEALSTELSKNNLTPTEIKPTYNQSLLEFQEKNKTITPVEIAKAWGYTKDFGNVVNTIYVARGLNPVVDESGNIIKTIPLKDDDAIAAAQTLLGNQYYRPELGVGGLTTKTETGTRSEGV